jgi:hypothetical protein
MAKMANGTPGLVPRPDPTLLTTEQLNREIASLRVAMEARMDAGDKAILLVHEETGRRLDSLAKFRETEVNCVREVMDEKLRALDERLIARDKEVSTRFQERDTRSEREARDNKIAVDAAFAAAKEAVAENNKSSALATDKSEAGFTKQIDQLTLLIETRAKASDDKIDDIKEQLSNRRGNDQGRLDSRTFVFALMGLIIAIISAAALIGAHL